MARSDTGRRPSMVDVARLAEVSAQTVSRVSNGESNVSPKTRERVLAAMKELSYRPNAAARALNSGKFHTIGMVYHSLQSVGTHRPLEAISRFAAAAGYATMLLPVDVPTQQNADGAFSKLAEMAVDVIIAIMPTPFLGPSERLPLYGTPTLIQASTSAEGVASIDFDHGQGTRAAVDHLLSLGHRTVDHISGPLGAPDGTARRTAWEEALHMRGRVVPTPAFGDWSAMSGYFAARELLGRSPRPTAIFAASDLMALGAYHAISEAGLRIPQDVSVVGFDNLETTEVYAPPLTTVEQNWDLFGKTALEMSVAMIHGAVPDHRIIPTRLILRHSTAEPSTTM